MKKQENNIMETRNIEDIEIDLDEVGGEIVGGAATSGYPSKKLIATEAAVSVQICFASKQDSYLEKDLAVQIADMKARPTTR